MPEYLRMFQSALDPADVEEVRRLFLDDVRPVFRAMEVCLGVELVVRVEHNVGGLVEGAVVSRWSSLAAMDEAVASRAVQEAIVRVRQRCARSRWPRSTRSRGDGRGPPPRSRMTRSQMTAAEDLTLGPVAVLVPVKAFAEAKLRLAPALPPLGRAALAREMASHVLSAARPLPAAVVCDDPEVAAWARAERALVIWEPERGLNRAVEAGVERLGRAGARRVIVAHGDLPLASGLGAIARFRGVTIVPDRAGNGTNVICVPTGAGFTFSYGPGSFTRHTAEAFRLGLALRVVRGRALGHDVDTPADLAVGARA